MIRIPPSFLRFFRWRAGDRQIHLDEQSVRGPPGFVGNLAGTRDVRRKSVIPDSKRPTVRRIGERLAFEPFRGKRRHRRIADLFQTTWEPTMDLFVPLDSQRESGQDQTSASAKRGGRHNVDM